ncbi:hypothetical protein [Brucella anthropi]|uniref:hypothetical protein n=1 Tax=Brucella anthropi TaxID=529 RepID=UPI0004A7571A|nr:MULTISPECIES: hypothetical protein [Brucella/Ochrobactrum group]KAB2781204.1 hypothetical protein F9K99_08310 [Brucella anthropi]
MIPIREAFEQIGRKQFPTEWTGEEIAILDNWPTVDALNAFTTDQRAAFDRCVAIMAHLTQELEAGRAVAIITKSKHERVEISANYWRDSAFNGRWQDGAENLAEYLTDRGTHRFIRYAVLQATGKAKAGRKPLLDVEDYRQAFEDECEKRGGHPNPRHPDNDWRSQRDVADWLAKLAARDSIKLDKDDTTAKKYAKELMQMGNNS